MRNPSTFDPWKYYNEDVVFAYQRIGRNEIMHFSILYETIGRYAVAIYRDATDYLQARKYTPDNRKQEPVPYLRNAIVCQWGNRADVSKENYALIKELGFRFRGNGG